MNESALPSNDELATSMDAAKAAADATKAPPRPEASQETPSTEQATPAAPTATTAKPPKRDPWLLRTGKGCLKSCMVSSFLFCLLALCFIVTMFRGCSRWADALGSLELTSLASAEKRAFEKISDESLQLEDGQPAKNAPKVLHLQLAGVITSSDAGSVWDSGSAFKSVNVLKNIRKATFDEELAGIFLEIDSPGGEVTASDVLWNALEEFKASRKGRFVVVLMGSSCCSGGYYVAVAADKLLAHPTTITGSIGVKLESYNVKELARKIGIKEVTIASGNHKNMLTPFEDLTPEQEALLQDMISQLHRRFVGIVAKGRNKGAAEIAALADGRVMTADDAQKAGLVDGVGYLKGALAAVHEFTGGKTPEWVRYGSRGVGQWLDSEFFGACTRTAVKAAQSQALESVNGVRAVAR